MFGDDYFKRTQYSADMIHEQAMQWLDRQSADQPFFGLLTYTLPHAELAQPNDSLLAGYKRNFSTTAHGADRRVRVTILPYTPMHSLPQ